MFPCFLFPSMNCFFLFLLSLTLFPLNFSFFFLFSPTSLPDSYTLILDEGMRACKPETFTVYPLFSCVFFDVNLSISFTVFILHFLFLSFSQLSFDNSVSATHNLRDTLHVEWHLVTQYQHEQCCFKSNPIWQCSFAWRQ